MKLKKAELIQAATQKEERKATRDYERERGMHVASRSVQEYSPEESPGSTHRRTNPVQYVQQNRYGECVDMQRAISDVVLERNQNCISP